MVRPNANTRSIDDLELTRFYGDVFDTSTVREAMDGVDDVYYCVVDTRAWLRDTAPLFRTNVKACGMFLTSPSTNPTCAGSSSPARNTTVGRRHGHVATEDDVIDSRGLTPTSNPGCKPKTW